MSGKISKIFQLFGQFNSKKQLRVQLNNAEQKISLLQGEVTQLKNQNSFMVHELRTPLTSVRGYSKILAVTLAEKKDIQNAELAGSIVRNAEHMQKMIDDLRYMDEISKANVTRESVDLSGLMNSQIVLLSDQTKNRNITFSVTPGLKANCDIKLIRPALFNLIKNAVKYTSKHPSAKIQFGWNEQRKAFFISDDGAGFDPSKKEKLFNMFQRLHTSNEFEGTGVGLVIVRQIIVELHGGTIYAESDGQDKGATFYFTLQNDVPVKS